MIRKMATFVKSIKSIKNFKAGFEVHPAIRAYSFKRVNVLCTTCNKYYDTKFTVKKVCCYCRDDGCAILEMELGNVETI